ncbi:MAG TPA: diguanylate cyclase [Pyrinomonadaceae bacterium]|nr:diguanylate cyclase [Pyrinomonadaceae bacterium]
MRILIAEDDAVSRRVLEANLRKWGHEIVVTTNGIEACRAMQAENAPRLAILDWMMPGLSGVEVCRQVREAAGTTPVYIILLTSMSRSENIVEGLEAGADDYLTKPFDHHELKVRLQTGARIVELQESLARRVRELEAAIGERKQIEEQLRNLALVDDLTGLYNRRGFLTLAEHQAKVDRRSIVPSLLIYADMDGLKQINDTHGHSEGSQAISRVADILRESFRESDIIGRLGGDEFVVLAPNVPAIEIESIIARVRGNVDSHNQQDTHGYSLALSIGAVSIAHDTRLTVEELIAQADEAMYQDKRSKQGRGAARAELQPVKHGATSKTISRLNAI